MNEWVDSIVRVIQTQGRRSTRRHTCSTATSTENPTWTGLIFGLILRKGYVKRYLFMRKSKLSTYCIKLCYHRTFGDEVSTVFTKQ